MLWKTKAIIQFNKDAGVYGVFGNREQICLKREGNLEELQEEIAKRLEIEDRLRFRKMFPLLLSDSENNQKDLCLEVRILDEIGGFHWYNLHFLKDKEYGFIIFEEKINTPKKKNICQNFWKF